MLIGVGVSCRKSYCYVTCNYLHVHVSLSGLIIPGLVKRANFLLSFTCNYVVAVRRVFFMVLGIRCIILVV